MHGSHTIALLVSLACSLSVAQAQTPVRTLTDPGALNQHKFGETVANLGDLDGDGFSEVAVSAFVDSSSYVNVYSSSTGVLLRQHLGSQSYEKMGRAVVSIGDVDSDGTADYAIGSDGYNVTSPVLLTDAGRVTIFSGASGAVLQQLVGTVAGREIGFSLDATGDVDGDTVPDLIVGSSGSGAWVYSASGSVIHALALPAPSDRFGCSVAGLGDLNGDGRAEFAVGASQFQTGTGYVRVYNGYDKSLRYTLTGPTFNCWFGQCIRRMGDLDGDGRSELAVGAPAYHGATGGEGLLRIFSGNTGALLRGVVGQNNNEYFGTSIDAGADIDGDGLGDLVVGAPNAGNVQISGAGAVRALSGATGVQLFEVRGTVFYSNLGLSVAWLADVDGDGRPDFVAGSHGEVLNGAAVIFSSACAPPQTYCSAKVNSLGCTPAISFTGHPSLVATDDFHILATNVINNKPGLMFYGFRSNSTPLTGGTLCVSQVIHRSAGQYSGGNPPPNDCSGAYDFFLRRADLVADNLAIGQTMYAQVWARDPGFPSPNNSSLSDALRFTFCD